MLQVHGEYIGNLSHIDSSVRFSFDGCYGSESEPNTHVVFFYVVVHVSTGGKVKANMFTVSACVRSVAMATRLMLGSAGTMLPSNS